MLNLEIHSLAYKFSTGKSPTFLFCPGFNSSMDGNKARALEAYCLKLGHRFIRFDYSGHGLSDGDFADGTITQWLDDTLAIIDKLVEGKVILIGSSMGAWLALLSALVRPEKVAGLLLIACAADMTKYYAEKSEGLKPQVDESERVYYSIGNDFDDGQPYRIYQSLLDDGQQHCLLGSDIELSIPISLIHGKKDDVVPWQRTQLMADKLCSKRVDVEYIDDGDHRLSKQSDLEVITKALDHLLNDVIACRA